MLGFTLNNLTLFGLVLAIGIVVDDAIVVLENVERWIAKGYEPRTATIKAMDEITGPIIAITLSVLGVPAERVHAGHLRPVLPPVRADDLRSDDHLGHQRHDAHAVACRDRCSKPRTSMSDGHEHVREALPWWFFGILAAALAYLLGPADMAGKIIRVISPLEGHKPPTWLPWMIYSALSCRSSLSAASSAGSLSSR